MHTPRYPGIAAALLLICQGCSDDAQSTGGAAGTGTGGSSSGGSVAQPMGGSASTSAGSGNPGGTVGTSGSAMTSGGSSAQAGGGAGGSANGGSAGTAGGNGGTATAGSAGSGGSAGAGSCVKNLSCKLSPPPSTGDIYQDCVDRINQFLTQCACLPALKRATEGEACANQMAEYDAGKNSPHAGAIANICQPNGSQNECPGYASNNQVISLCFQQMWDEGPPPAGSCTGACYEEHGHFINMTDPGVTKVACGFYTTSDGKVWAAQNFF